MPILAAPRFSIERPFGRESDSVRRVRAAWISDVHLGTRGANAGALLDFLREYEFETLYVVGDLIDVTFLSYGCNNSFLISIAFAKSESSDSRNHRRKGGTNAH